MEDQELGFAQQEKLQEGKEKKKTPVWAALIAAAVLLVVGCIAVGWNSHGGRESAASVKAVNPEYLKIFEDRGITHRDELVSEEKSGCFAQADEEHRTVEVLQVFYKRDKVTGMRQTLYIGTAERSREELDVLESACQGLVDEANEVIGVNAEWQEIRGYYRLCVRSFDLDNPDVLDQVIAAGLAEAEMDNRSGISFRATRKGLLENGYVEK